MSGAEMSWPWPLTLSLGLAVILRARSLGPDSLSARTREDIVCPSQFISLSLHVCLHHSLSLWFQMRDFSTTTQNRQTKHKLTSLNEQHMTWHEVRQRALERARPRGHETVAGPFVRGKHVGILDEMRARCSQCRAHLLSLFINCALIYIVPTKARCDKTMERDEVMWSVRSWHFT